MEPTLMNRSFVAAGLTVLTVPTLLGCLERSNEIRDGDPRLTARPRTPSEPFTTGESQVGLEFERDAYLYVPQTYSPDVPAPLFVALHGAGGAGADWSGFYDDCEARGMVLLAPDSRSSTWDRISGQFAGDVWFLDAALNYTFDRCAIDPAHIALGGFSDGASYALSLGVSNGDLFTHLIAFSPGLLAPAEPLVGKPRIFVSHGTQDPILSVAASRDRIVPALREDGYDVTYEEFVGGHQVPRVVSEQALGWFLG
jgi:phospholipase/carboxylesterase